jgi:hypothetical protein
MNEATRTYTFMDDPDPEVWCTDAEAEELTGRTKRMLSLIPGIQRMSGQSGTIWYRISDIHQLMGLDD